MNIALFGYGKMGKMIEGIALERGHKIVVKVDQVGLPIDFSQVDVAIDFSMPDAAFDNIISCFRNDVPVISGTTGWLDRYPEAVQICKETNGAFIYASNFSLGVNIFFELNKYLAGMMSQLEEYQLDLEEIHHTQKLDAPSGTAITLAEGIIEQGNYEEWKLDKTGKGIVPIHSKREGSVPGTHSITYKSSVDSLKIKHTAHNREGFAQGAVVAAEWIAGKTGVYSMRDVLNLN